MTATQSQTPQMAPSSPPVKSGRINTKKGATVRYGRVEVTATLPSGDRIWPAIWMLPVNTSYGSWPRSGEIDIA